MPVSIASAALDQWRKSRKPLFNTGRFRSGLRGDSRIVLRGSAIFFGRSGGWFFARGVMLALSACKRATRGRAVAGSEGERTRSRHGGIGFRSALLSRASITALALVGVFAASGPLHAQAIGGTGGTSGGGVAGGASGSPGGDDNSLPGVLGGGGGGGGGPGQSGGDGGYSADGDASGGFGGRQPLNPGNSGGQGTTLSFDSGGGGGGGGAGGVNGLATSGALTVTVSPTVGAGGAGGAAGAGAPGTPIGDGAGGGAGGAGGYGVIDTGSADVITVNAGVTVAGGSGGTGGAGGAGAAAVTGGNGGNGGNGGGGGGGGIGVYFANGGGTLINNEIVARALGGSGGLGGAGGSGVTPGANGTIGAPGADGAGVQGAGLTVVNAGSISGGGSAAAIHFTGGTNTLASSAGGSLSGAIIMDAGALVLDQTGDVGGPGINTNTSVRYGSAINGLGSLVVRAGSNTVTLTGANTYTGGTTISSGTLQIGAGGTTGSIVGNVTDNGAFVFDRSDFFTFSGVISGTGSVSTLQAGGEVNLTGQNTYSGPTTVNGGALLGGAANAFSPSSALTINSGGIVDLGGFAQQINSVFLSGGVIEHGQLTSGNGITSTGGTVDGVGGTTSLTVNSGVTTLNTTTGANAYTGATTINGGTLLGGATNAFSADSTTRVNAGGTLDLGGLSQTINSLLLSGGIIQNGALSTARGIVSTGGTLSSVAVSTSGVEAHALSVTPGSQVNLGGTNTLRHRRRGRDRSLRLARRRHQRDGSDERHDLRRRRERRRLRDQRRRRGFADQARRGDDHDFGRRRDRALRQRPASSGSAGSITASGTLNVKTMNAAAAAVGLQGNGASILATGGGTIVSAGNAIEFMGGTNQTATFDNFNINNQTGDLIFADPSVATINFNSTVANAGTNNLLDATNHSVVTLNASASTLTGAIKTDSTSTTNVNLTNGTTWTMTGSSTVTNLNLTNSVVVFAPPSEGGGFKTLTVTNYVGSGAAITLNAALGGSNSPSDKIVVNRGSATGTTLLTINNVGGARRPNVWRWHTPRRGDQWRNDRAQRLRPRQHPRRRRIQIHARSDQRELVSRFVADLVDIPADEADIANDADDADDADGPAYLTAGLIVGRGHELRHQRRQGAADPDHHQPGAQLDPARRDPADQQLQLRGRLRLGRLVRRRRAGPLGPERRTLADRRFLLQPVVRLGHLGRECADRRWGAHL